mgnify:FL=1
MKAKKLFLMCAFSAIGSLGIAQAVTHIHDWTWGRGDDGYESGEDIVVSDDEYNYTVGEFEGTVDFHPFSSVVGSVTSNGGRDIYICKRNKHGHFVWVKSFGGSSFESVSAIDVDSESIVYVTGLFYGTVDFDPSPTTSFTMTQSGSLSADAFICKYDANGNFVWAKMLNGRDLLNVTDITVDGQNHVHVTGSFTDLIDLDPDPTQSIMIASSHAWDEDGFSVTLDGNGNHVKYYLLKGSGSDVIINSVAVDANYNQYFTGKFDGLCDFNYGAGSSLLTSTGTYDDAFVLKVDASNTYQWAKQFLSSVLSEGKGIHLDATNNVYTVGQFRGAIDLDPGTTNNLHSSPTFKIGSYISKLDPAGNFVYGKTISGTGTSSQRGNVLAEGLSVTDNGQVYFAGYFDKKVDFNPGIGTHIVTAGGKNDAFICGLNTFGNFWSFSWAESHYTDGYVRNHAIDMSTGQDIYTTGRLTRMVDFNAVGSPHYVISGGGYDMFTNKLERYNPFPYPSFKSAGTVENLEVSIFPNPTADFVTVSIPGEGAADIEVYSAAGQLIYTEQCEAGFSRISLEDFGNGVYTVIVKQKETSSYHKVIKH